MKASSNYEICSYLHANLQYDNLAIQSIHYIQQEPESFWGYYYRLCALTKGFSVRVEISDDIIYLYNMASSLADSYKQRPMSEITMCISMAKPNSNDEKISRGTFVVVLVLGVIIVLLIVSTILFAIAHPSTIPTSSHSGYSVELNDLFR